MPMTLASLKSYLDNLNFQTGESQALWRNLHALGSPFGVPLTAAECEWLRPLPIQPSSLPPFVIDDSPGRRVRLPIAQFRFDPVSYLQASEAVREFRSSGTTQATQALSTFSADGLLLYKACALKTFAAVITDVMGEDGILMPGISLVPRVAEWPASSLAQMVAWIGEFWPLTYAAADNLKETLAAHGRQPVFLFGTAFHFVNLIDAGLRIELPPGSMVIETGGYKGRSRSLSRPEFYELIEGALRVPQARIVSEYGMCELASQAYDWIGARSGQLPSLGVEERTFRFPRWATPFVTQGLGLSQREGRGSLIVDDLARRDFPWPLEVEDVVTLGINGAFTLRSRVPAAPLKGCSLLAENVLATNSAARDITPAPTHKRWPIDTEAVAIRAKAFSQAFRAFCHDNVTLKALADDIGSLAAAKSALADVLAGLPGDDSAWIEAVKRSVSCHEDGERSLSNQPRQWLFILPSSHSVAGLYPIGLGYAVGLKIAVRLPPGQEQTSAFLSRFLDLMDTLPDAEIARLSSRLRIGESPLPRGLEAILCFGETATIEAIRNRAGLPVNGFGSSLAASVFTAVDAKDQLPALIKDAFSLGQRGCLSARLAVAIGLKPAQALGTLGPLLLNEARRFWQSPLAFDARIALDHEEFALRFRGGNVVPRQSIDEPLVAFYQLSDTGLPARAAATLALSAVDVISQRPFVLPVLVVARLGDGASEGTALSALSQLSDLRTLTLPPSLLNNRDLVATLRESLPQVSLRPLGHANILPWDGTHEHKPLFTVAPP